MHTFQHPFYTLLTFTLFQHPSHPHLAPLSHPLPPPPVADVDPLDQITVQKGAESMGMADIIAANLQQAGFDQVEVEPADAQVRESLSLSIIQFTSSPTFITHYS